MTTRMYEKIVNLLTIWFGAELGECGTELGERKVEPGACGVRMG